MQKNFPSFLRKRDQRRSLEQPLQSPQNSTIGEGASFNVVTASNKYLPNLASLQTASVYRERFIRFSQILILVVYAVIGVLLAVNHVYDIKLSKAHASLMATYDDYMSMVDIRNALTKLSVQTQTYKQLKGHQESVSNLLDPLTSKLPDGASIDALRMPKPGTLTMSLTNDDIVSMSTYMQDLLATTERLQGIVIQSVNYSSTRGTYQIRLDFLFK